MLEAMRQARFSLWRVERRHETTGLILRDLLRGEEIWLVDEAMEKSAPPGVEMAARLLQPESFAMTARIIVPVTPDLMEEVFTRAPALRRTQGDALASDPRFAIGIYRAAVATGAMDFVRFKRTDRASFMPMDACPSPTQKRQTPAHIARLIASAATLAPISAASRVQTPAALRCLW